MPIFSNLMFRAVHWASRRGLRGETYAYWYLRRLGYIFIARNYAPRGIKGELDLVGYDRDTLAFVEVSQPHNSQGLARSTRTKRDQRKAASRRSHRATFPF